MSPMNYNNYNHQPSASARFLALMSSYPDEEPVASIYMPVRNTRTSTTPQSPNYRRNAQHSSQTHFHPYNHLRHQQQIEIMLAAHQRAQQPTHHLMYGDRGLPNPRNYNPARNENTTQYPVSPQNARAPHMSNFWPLNQFSNGPRSSILSNCLLHHRDQADEQVANRICPSSSRSSPQSHSTSLHGQRSDEELANHHGVHSKDSPSFPRRSVPDKFHVREIKDGDVRNTPTAGSSKNPASPSTLQNEDLESFSDSETYLGVLQSICGVSIETEAKETELQGDVNKIQIQRTRLHLARDEASCDCHSMRQMRIVWSWNLFDEVTTIKKLIADGRQFYIAMDTEFPGFVYTDHYDGGREPNSSYQMIKANVDLMSAIQLGMTLFDENGDFEYSGGIHTWQFNFAFDVEIDIHNPDSIKFLNSNGIDLAMHKKWGIRWPEFSCMMLSSGLLRNKRIRFLTFHGIYDYCYFLKLILHGRLPNSQTEFIELMNTFFPYAYDLRSMALYPIPHFNGGLENLAEVLQVRRTGYKHNGGSDAYMTGSCYFALQKLMRKAGREFPNADLNGKLWGVRARYSDIDYSPRYYDPMSVKGVEPVEDKVKEPITAAGITSTASQSHAYNSHGPGFSHLYSFSTASRPIRKSDPESEHQKYIKAILNNYCPEVRTELRGTTDVITTPDPDPEPVEEVLFPSTSPVSSDELNWFSADEF